MLRHRKCKLSNFFGTEQYNLHHVSTCLLCNHWHIYTRRDCVCSDIMAVICYLEKERKPLLLALHLIRSYHVSKRSLPQHNSAFFSRQSRCALHFMRRHIWSSRQDDLTRALSDAEKIVGYPTSFLNLRYLLSDEISNIAMYMKRFAMSKHPMLRTARGFVLDENHTMQTRGLLVLLVSKASRPCLQSDWSMDQDLVADIHSSQRQLADITETIHTGSSHQFFSIFCSSSYMCFS